MMKKILAFVLCLSMLLFVGCAKKGDTLSVDSDSQSSVESKPVAPTYTNPLTGLTGLDEETSANRPVAVMINNLSTAQRVQTGLGKADIIYETEVEGGITRLMAVFQDFKNAGKIGTIRSSRYAYIDLAMGHNAIYAYHGIDEKYAGPHIKDTDAIAVSENNGCERISNGLATEHTLYGYTDRIWKAITASSRTIKNTSTAAWVTFADENAPVKLEYTANQVMVPFSPSYHTTFKYDAATGRYTRYFNNNEVKDYVTSSSITVKNVFVLNTTITDYPDGYHRKVALESGEGYYFVNGTYTKINWSKGSSSNGFQFKKADGTALSVNPGNSWVCIADKTKSQAVIGE